MIPYYRPRKSSLCIVAIAMSLTLSSPLVLAGSCCGGGATPTEPTVSPTRRVPTRQREAEPPFQAPHGGQLTKTVWNYFEVVYGPQETRLYVFNMFRDPLRVGRLQGQVVMQVRSTGKTHAYPLHHVQPDAGQDYLATSVDLTRVRRGDMDVEFSLSGVPSAADSEAKFVQLFGSPEPLAALQATDNLPLSPNVVPGVRGSCCAAGASCCNSSASTTTADCCNQRVVDDFEMATPSPAAQPSPIRRLPPIAHMDHGPQGATSSRPKPTVAVVESTPADSDAIRLQGICPVMKTPLGSHGPPTKLLIGDEALFVCCQGCVSKVRTNPEEYLAMVAQH